MRLSRRNFIAGLGASAALAAACRPKPHDVLGVKRIAITMDDFTMRQGLPMTPLERNDAILSAFAGQNLQAIGFVTGSFVDSDTGRTVVQSWARQSHVIGNHTWTHPFASQISADEFAEEVLTNQSFIGQYSTSQKVLRFPFLDEGNTLEHRDALRAWLNENGFQNLPVTVDSFDWKINERLEARLRDNPAAETAGYRDYYLEASLKAANYAHSLASDIGLGGLPHTFLCHHNELNALYMKDLLAHFKDNGWQLVDAQVAIDHPALQIQPVSLNRQGTLLRVLEAEAIRRADQDELKPRPYPFARDFGEADMITRGL